MANVKSRLELAATVLQVIDQRRTQTKDPSVGVGAEHFLVERELRELADAAAAREATTEGRVNVLHWISAGIFLKPRAVLLAKAGRWITGRSR